MVVGAQSTWQMFGIFVVSKFFDLVSRNKMLKTGGWESLDAGKNLSILIFYPRSWGICLEWKFKDDLQRKQNVLSLAAM